MLHLFLNQSQEEVGIFYISLIVGLVDLDEVAEFFLAGARAYVRTRGKVFLTVFTCAHSSDMRDDTYRKNFTREHALRKPNTLMTTLTQLTSWT